MGRFTKRLVGGIAVASLFVGGAFAQTSLLDDFSGGTNQNKFGDYWYFFDDNQMEATIGTDAGKKGTSQVKSAIKDGNQLLFDPSVSFGTGRSGRAAKMEFKLGQTFDMAYDNRSKDASRDPKFATCEAAKAASSDYTTGCFKFGQFVGIGTNLVPDGSKEGPAGFKNATAAKFWARAESKMSIRFFLEMSHIGEEKGVKVKDGAYYGTWLDVGPAWKDYTVPFVKDPCSGTRKPKPVDWPANMCKGENGLVQPDWVIDQEFIDEFDLSKTVKVAWQVQAAGDEMAAQLNTNDPSIEMVNYENTFYLDMIEFEGFEFVRHDMCKDCIKDSKPADTQKFDKFEDGTAQNRLNWYFYAYDDTKTVVDPGKGKGTSEFIGINGSVDCDNPYIEDGGCGLVPVEGAIQIEFELGEVLTIGGYAVQPFVGMGTNLYDEKETPHVYYNATAENVAGLYFEFKTDVEKITFEVQDKWDVLSLADGGRPESAVWYIDLPGKTGTGWKKAVVPFSALKMHTEWADVAAWANNPANSSKVALDKTALAKFQFKIQEGAGTTGEFRVREVWTVGPAGSKAKLAASASKAMGLHATYSRGVVGVNWNAASTIASGKISLVNTKGKVISSAPISKVSGSKVTANLGNKSGIPTGMYFVRIDAKDVNGKRIVQQAPVSVVK